MNRVYSSPDLAFFSVSRLHVSLFRLFAVNFSKTVASQKKHIQTLAQKKKTSPAWNSFVTYYLFLAYKFSSLPKTEEENSSEWMWISSASSLLKVHFLVQGKNFKCFLHPLSYSFVGSDLFRALQVMDVLVRTPSLFLALNMPYIFFNEFNLLA